ncbi:MAG: hypothetical protein ABSG43_31105 [Solirubrobacteraceae bacterium]|jgi:hypothetical protein
MKYADKYRFVVMLLPHLAGLMTAVVLLETRGMLEIVRMGEYRYSIELALMTAEVGHLQTLFL